jgi:hypothetical protein
MQNSLERIFEGLEDTLRSVVAPTITDPYVLSQVTSVAEIVANLSTRVEWSSAQLQEISDRVRPILERAAAGSATGLPLTRELLARSAPGPVSPNEALLDARDRHLYALQEVQRSLEHAGDEELERMVREFLSWQVERETTLLRTGMFSAPKK